VCHLPSRHSDVDPDDLSAASTLIESHITVALLRLCHRVATSGIRLERDTAGDLYCIAYIWIPAALPRRSAGARATRGRGDRSSSTH
jgi:hypothetical protein